MAIILYYKLPHPELQPDLSPRIRWDIIRQSKTHVFPSQVVVSPNLPISVNVTHTASLKKKTEGDQASEKAAHPLGAQTLSAMVGAPPTFCRDFWPELKPGYSESISIWFRHNVSQFFWPIDTGVQFRLCPYAYVFMSIFGKQLGEYICACSPNIIVNSPQSSRLG